MTRAEDLSGRWVGMVSCLCESVSGYHSRIINSQRRLLGVGDLFCPIRISESANMRNVIVDIKMANNTICLYGISLCVVRRVRFVFVMLNIEWI